MAPAAPPAKKNKTAIWWKKQLTSKLPFNLCFWGVHWAIFAYGWWKQASDERLAGLNKLRFSVWFSRGAGLVLSVDCMLILLTVCRTIMRWIRPKIRFIPFDENLWMHRQLAYSILLFSIVHTSAHYVNFFNVEQSQVRPVRAIQIHYTEAGPLTGHVMLFCMVLMYTSAHHRIRQQSFETFWYTHHLFIPFFIALYTHTTGCFVRDTAQAISPFAGQEFWTHCIGYLGWRWELFTGGFYLIERLYREIRAIRETTITRVVRHPNDVVELQFKKPSFKYKAGQWLFLQVPSISKYQWHPFTISSCPYDPYVSVHIRQVGDFTRALGDAVGAGQAQEKFFEDEALDNGVMYEVMLDEKGQLPNGQMMPRIRIDGPYGAPAEDVFENEIAVLIGTGIGVTPWASVLKNIWHMRNSVDPRATRLRRVEFVWVCKESSAFGWFQTLLQSLEQQALEQAKARGEADEFLRLNMFWTKKLDQDTAQNIMLNQSGEHDAVTALRSGTNFSRPDWRRFFGKMADQIEQRTYMSGLGLEANAKTTVGIYFCGPTVAAREIKSAAKAANRPDVKFRFWKEHF